MTEFLLLACVVWRITHLLVCENGPAYVIDRLRARLGDSVLGQALDCFYCASIWIAAPVAIVGATSFGSWLVLWLALSGAASLLEQATTKERAHV